MLCLTVPTIYGFTQRNEIPFNKKGKRLIFIKQQIIDWVKEGRRKTVKEINELKRLKRLKRPKRLKLNKLLISNEEQEIGLEIRHEIEPYIEPDIDRKILVRWIEKGGSNSLKKKRI